jgi:outer membrane protein assembly factor BamB
MRSQVPWLVPGCLVLLFASPCVHATNEPSIWPQWGGPDRNFKTDVKGLANSWPEKGPRQLWSRELGEGHSSIVTDGIALYTMLSQGEQEAVVALDPATGKTIWEYRYDAPTKGMDYEPGKGPHATPLLVGDRLYTTGAIGKLLALDKRTGKLIWAHDLWKEYHGRKLRWGYSCSPIAYQETIIVTVGGSGQAVMAFRQADGAIAWKSQNFKPAYASPLLIRVEGQDQLVCLMSNEVIGVDPRNGDLLWSHPHATEYGIAISTPVWSDGGLLFISSAYNGGSRLLKLARQDGKTNVTEVWFNRKVQVHWADVLRIGEYFYCSSGHDGPVYFSAVEVKTGKVAWQVRSPKASVLSADGKLILLDQEGYLSLATVSPEGLKVSSKVRLLKPISWTAPTLVGKTLYVRDRKTIMALDVG